MKFICLGYYDHHRTDALPESEREAIMADCRPHMERQYETGRVFADAGLGTAMKCMRRVGGAVIVTDGPYAEAKELLGSALILEARDMDDAVRVAALHPTTQLPVGERLGWRYEIRPIHYFESTRFDPACVTAADAGAAARQGES